MKKLILFTVCLLSYTSSFAKEYSEKKAFTLANTTCLLKIKSASMSKMVDIKFAVVDSLIIGKVSAAQYMDKDFYYTATVMGDVLKKDKSTMIFGVEVSSTNVKTGDYWIFKGAIVMMEQSRNGFLPFTSVAANGQQSTIAVFCEVAEK